LQIELAVALALLAAVTTIIGRWVYDPTLVVDGMSSRDRADIYARGISAMTNSVAAGTRMATNKHVTCRN
jgi:hypothetical protein